MGLVLANSAQFIAHTLVIWWFARRAFGWLPSPALRRLIPRVALLAAVSAVAAWSLWSGMERVSPDVAGPGTIGWRLALVGLPGLVFAGIYVTGIVRLAPDEVRAIVAAVRSRLPGR
jgi:peptidoglycan biosynthesis protein MviN/MurJ (putative lipid II flippase)